MAAAVSALIDRLVAVVSPARGMERYLARQRLQRAYEAASPRDKWRPRRAGASADTDHLADARIVRNKARALVQNVPYIKAGVDALVAHTVGTGITPKPLGGQAEKVKQLWAEWSRVCDADGRLDFCGLQAMAYRAMEVDGEVLVRLRPRRPVDGLPVPLQLQLLEIDWLDGEREKGAADGNEIVNGIEYDALGRRAAYWIFDQHPGDSAFRRFMRRVSGTQSRRVPAESIIHVYRADRPGQSRGFSRLATVIGPARDLALYEDAELARKNLESRLSVLVSGDASKMVNPGQAGEAPDPAKAAAGDLGQLPSGGITQLPQGVGVTVVEPTAAPGHVDYCKWRVHIIAAGMGVPFEMCTGVMKEVNFSSARVRISDFRRAVEQTQWLLLVPQLCDRVYRAFIDAAQLDGKVRGGDYAVDWATPKWDYVNPLQESQADTADIAMGLSSLSEKLRRRGFDPDLVYSEIKSDFDRLRADGTLDVLLLLQRGSVRMDGNATEAASTSQAGAAA